MRIPSLLFASDSQWKVAIASVWLIGLTISAFSMLRGVPRFKGAKEKEVAPTERVRVLHFTLTPLGFSPSSMTVPEGLYTIEVVNRSELSAFTLNLGRLSNHKLKEVDTAQKLGEWRGFFNLTSDNYDLLISEKSEWVVKLRVTK